MLRGFGYHQQEIADLMGISRGSAVNQLRKLKRAAENAHNIEEVFWNEMIDPESLTRIIAITSKEGKI